MEKTSTLDGFKGIKYGRARGNTTRLIDHAIQQLFDRKMIVVQDAWEYGRNRKANEHLFNCIIKRMSFEHNHIELKVDRNRLTVQI